MIIIFFQMSINYNLFSFNIFEGKRDVENEEEDEKVERKAAGEVSEEDNEMKTKKEANDQG